jgi:hypothetical protein
MHTHSENLRPDHAGSRLVPAPFALEDEDIAGRMATVILRQSGEGRPTEMHHFRDAPETHSLSADEIARHIGRASRIADRTVIRQDHPTFGTAEAPYDREARIREASALVLGMLPQIPTIHSTLRLQQFTNREIADLWDEIIARAADDFHAERGVPARIAS